MNLKKINRILVIRLSSLGDILLTTPLIRALKENNPLCEIDYILKEEYEPLLKDNPNISEIYKYPYIPRIRSHLVKIFRKKKYGLIIDLQSNMRSLEIKNRLNRKSVKFNKRSTAKFLLVNFKINLLKNAAQIPARYASSLRNLKLDDKGLDLFIPDNINSRLEKDSKYIGLAPGSRHFTKMWPSDYYAELGKMISGEGYKVVLLGGTADMNLCDSISARIPGSINLAGEDNILQVAADMKSCSAVVCNDSGLMHTACAAGVPVLAVFGSTVKEFGFTPYKSKNLILENNSLTCRPCSHIGRSSCPKGHFKCMLEITPAKALEGLKTLLT